MRQIKTLIKRLLLFFKIMPNSVIKNINIDYTTPQKKALLCYLDFRKTANSVEDSALHTNQLRCLQMIHILIKHNYAIDTCSCEDKHALRDLNLRGYSLVIGFGRIFQEACKYNAYKLIYMTEAPYSFAQYAEKARFDYFAKRHNMQPNTPHRTGEYYLKGQENDADAIMFQGEKSHFDSTGKKTYRVFPNAFINKYFDIKNIHGKKDPTKFVLFGTSNNWLRKGVDLLWEVFSKKSNLTLYICGKKVSAEAKQLGYKTKPENIILCGFVNYQSAEFIKIFTECTYIVLPSAFEGMSSAVATGMAHATIPVVTHNTGWNDFTDYCEYFEDYHLEVIGDKIEELSKANKKDIEARCIRCAQFAREHFTISAFSKSFNDILTDIER